MYLICRKEDGPLQVMARGECETFVRQFLKFNVSEREKEYCMLLKTEELDITLYMEKAPLEPPTILVPPPIPAPASGGHT